MRLIETIFPSACHICHRPFSGLNTNPYQVLCQDCHSTLELNGSHAGSTTREGRNIYFAGIYSGRAAAFMVSLKKGEQIWPSVLFGGELADAIRSLCFSQDGSNPVSVYCFLPPDSKSGWLRRGYSSVKKIAHEATRKLISGHPSIACQIVMPFWRAAGPSQKSLGATERWKNAASIKLKKNLPVLKPGSILLLVDDVLTTGATLSQCARLLEEHYARDVTSLALLFDLPAVD